MLYRVVRRVNDRLVSALAFGAAQESYTSYTWSKGPEWLNKQGYLPTFFRSLEAAQQFYDRLCSDFEVRELWVVEAQGILQVLPEPSNYNDINWPGNISDIISRNAPLTRGWPEDTGMGEIRLVKRIK
jgi:hypothetical protein